MKKSSLVKIFISLILVAFIGCNEKSDLSNNPAQNINETGDYYVLGLDDAMSSIDDATLEKNMGFTSDFASDNFLNDGRHKRRGKFRGKGLRLGLVFHKMDLTEDQKDSVKIFFDENRDCISTPIQQFREAAKEIMEAKKLALDAIRDSVKAGELTREDAREKIKLINDQTREEIENNEACVEARDAMCACNTNMMENITSILDEDQFLIWTDWLSERPTPCSGG
jgi:Spy/CpxP family protein refolding chaperone